MMIDKSLSIFLVVLFGASGIVILVLAWLQPMPASERILATFVGSVGLLVALVQALLLKSRREKTGAKQDMIEVEVEDEP